MLGSTPQMAPVSAVPRQFAPLHCRPMVRAANAAGRRAFLRSPERTVETRHLNLRHFAAASHCVRSHLGLR